MLAEAESQKMRQIRLDENAKEISLNWERKELHQILQLQGAKDEFHLASYIGKEDFIQDYCNRGERKNSTMQKQKVGGISNAEVS